MADSLRVGPAKGNKIETLIGVGVMDDDDGGSPAWRCRICSSSKTCLYQYVCNSLEWTYSDFALV